MRSIKDIGNNLLNSAGELASTLKAKVITSPIADIKLIKSKNEEVKKLIEESDEKVNPVREATNKKLEELGKLKIDIISTTLEEFAQHMEAIENLPFTKRGGGMALGTIVLGGLTIIPALSYMVWKGKFNYKTELKAVEIALMEARQYADNADKVIEKFNELSKFINNTMNITQRYDTECIKLNKQTANIRLYAGDNYSKYTQQQQLLIQKHTLYLEGLLKILNTPILNEDGSIHKEIIETMKYSNAFLNNAGEIIFTDFKKQKHNIRLLIIVVIAVLSIGVTLYVAINN